MPIKFEGMPGYKPRRQGDSQWISSGRVSSRRIDSDNERRWNWARSGHVWVPNGTPIHERNARIQDNVADEVESRIRKHAVFTYLDSRMQSLFQDRLNLPWDPLDPQSCDGRITERMRKRWIAAYRACSERGFSPKQRSQ